jgi:deoxycytidine triphosphate deaminase
MIINPQKIVQEGWVQNVDDSNQIQPNGIDLRLDKVFLVEGCGKITIDNKNRILAPEVEVKPFPIAIAKNNECYETLFYKLEAGRAYSFIFKEFVKVPVNAAAWIIQRSTVNRCGTWVYSSLYDSGFENYAGAYARPANPIEIEKGARVAQIVFWEAQSASMYDGVYKGKVNA